MQDYAFVQNFDDLYELPFDQSCCAGVTLMSHPPAETRTLLLVEDDAAFADLVRDMLQLADRSVRYDLHQVFCLADGERMLRSERIDVVLLDLTLPDASGLLGVKTLRQVSQDIPIVVLTALTDERLGLDCINAGAQDYLTKEELTPTVLRRAIGYSITRVREMQLRELRDTLARYRSLSSEGASTNVTAAMTGLGPLKARKPKLYDELTRSYSALFAAYIRQLAYKEEKPRSLMEGIATRLGDAGACPRDLLDIHVASLECAMEGLSVERARFYVIEGRLLALEMMGLLVEYFRIGSRRSFGSGDLQ